MSDTDPAVAPSKLQRPRLSDVVNAVDSIVAANSAGPRVCKYTGFKSTDKDPTWSLLNSGGFADPPTIKWGAFREGNADGRISEVAKKIMRKYYDGQKPHLIFKELVDDKTGAAKSKWDLRQATAISKMQSVTWSSQSKLFCCYYYFIIIIKLLY